MTESRHEMAVRHVTVCRQVVAEQRERIKRLRLQGKDTIAAENLLAQIEHSLAVFEDDLRQIDDPNACFPS